MKLIINNLGKTLIAVVVAILAIVLISSVFVPGVRDLIGTIFPSEINYIDKSDGTSSLKLSCTNTAVDIAVGDTVDLFANITALSSENEDIIYQLTDDYAKPVNERKHVFVYKVDAGNSTKLVSQIDTAQAGNWAVVYLLSDATEVVSLNVSYTVN